MGAESSHDRIVRRLDEAEGFLMLGMIDRALEILQSRGDWATMQFEASFLTGECRRRQGRLREALTYLERAARLRPGHPGVAMALGWCYKRTNRLAQAIDALEKAAAHDARNPHLLYNLACYWSLAGQVEVALERLANALEAEPELAAKVAGERDFDPIRSHPEFERIVYGRLSSA